MHNQIIDSYPFMIAERVTITIPTHSLEESHKFYTQIMGGQQSGRQGHHVRYQFKSHQIIVCQMQENFAPQEHCNHVDQYDVPVPHFGVVLSEPQFHSLGQKLKQTGITFIIQPHLRFPGLVGQQWTMFFKDPSGNNLEFKAMTNPSYLFAA